jgi:ribonuclease R
MNLRERILQRLRRPDYVPEDARLLADRLGAGRRERRLCAAELARMETEGVVVRVKKDRYCLPSDADLVTGRVSFRASGSAAVLPEAAAGAPARPPVEIPAEDTGVAMHGDRVVARLSDRPARAWRPGGEPRSSGRIIRVLERASTTLVGTLRQTRLFHVVVPDDPRFVHDVYAADPAASPLRPIPAVGDKVVVRLAEWTQRHFNPEGEIVEVLGRTHDPRAELTAILRKYRLDPSFPEPVAREAAAVSTEVAASDRRHRLDLRAVPTVTIDPDDARDFDDALSLEELPDGSTRVGIHIADVSHYVRPGGALDEEARRRGNSTYLVGTVVPMLPTALSNGICSLVEGADRLVKSVFIVFDRQGQPRETSFADAVIRSMKRLTYKQAYALLREDDPALLRALPAPAAHETGFTGRPLSELAVPEVLRLRDLVRKLWALAARMRRERMRRGSLDLDMPETKIHVDALGYAERLEKVVNDESHQLVEEFMLAANEAVARAVREAKLPCIYRVHDDPEPERLDELREFLGAFGVTCGDLSQRPALVRLLEDLRSHPQGHVLRTQVLRSLKKACYRASPDGHFGLHKRDYLHFTSPIRRYADLAAHRVFARLPRRDRERPPPAPKADASAARMASIAEHISTTETNSQEAERESVKVKLLEFFERELGRKKKTRFEAVITETRNHGMFVELAESMAFGLVHVSTLADDLYFLTPEGSALVGRRTKRRFAVGGRIEVTVARVDRFKRQIDFHVASMDAARPKTRSRERRRRT